MLCASVMHDLNIEDFLIGREASKATKNKISAFLLYMGYSVSLYTPPPPLRVNSK